MKPTLYFYSPFFFPELISTGRYNTVLVEGLAREGYEVQVMALFPIYPGWKPRFSRAKLKGVGIERGGLFLRFPKSGLFRRVVLELGYTVHAVSRTLMGKKKGHGVVVFPPMLFSPFIRLIFGKRARFVGIVHDIQGIMAELPGYISNPAYVSLLRILERRIFNQCDKVVALSNAMAEVLHSSYGIPAKRIRVHYPFVTLNRTQRTDALGHLFPDEYRHIVYSGALGVKQYPQGLLRFFQGLVRRHTDVMCHVFSRGPWFDTLCGQEMGREERIRFHDLVPEAYLYELYLRSHVQVVPQLAGVSRGAIPSKLPNLMAAGVPVFAMGDPESEVGDLVHRYGDGIYSDSWKLDILLEKMDQLLKMAGKRTHDERQRAAAPLVEDYFSITPLIQEIRQCIPSAVPIP